MSKFRYAAKTFTPAGLAVVEEAERICTDYAAQGYQLTLRQLYYRFIAGDLFPESRRDAALGTKNTERNYKWLGGLVSDARLDGLIDWSHVTDRTRRAAGGDYGMGSPAGAIRAWSDAYGITHWDGQPEYVEVWVEKEALADVVSRPARRWDVASFACKGYVSQSAMHDAALRIRRQERAGRKCTIIHLGDHDPSGLDMTRDIRDRLATFLTSARVDRIALNMDQVDELNPPPSPAKITDSRAAEYIDIYGDDSWELDAIEPAALDTLVDEAIQSHLNRELFDARVEREEREQADLVALSDNWDQIRSWMVDQEMIDDDE